AIPQDAETIAFGFRIPSASGAHAALVDSIALTSLGDANAGNAPPDRLSARAVDNLTAFARLYGYVRYFHPSDEAANADWDALLRAGVERVEDAQSPGALRDALRDVFAPVAPSVRILLASARAPNLDVPRGETLLWVHRGLGGGQYGGQPTGFI